MPYNLSRDEILQAYRLYSAGNSINAISRMTGRTRNTISAHLSGRLDYDDELRAKCNRILSYTSRRPGDVAPIPGWLTLDEASLLIPWRPSRKWIYDAYVRSGKLRTEKVRGVTPTQPLWVTCTQPQWVADFVRRSMGPVNPGLGVYRRYAHNLLDDDANQEFYRQLVRGFSLPCAKRRKIVYAHSVRSAAEAAGCRFTQCGTIFSAFLSLAEHQFALILPSDLTDRPLVTA